ncbi:M10 family metallopeptidase domain-containing protein [Mariniblastus sp.]|nr:M10 family metallopeptidase domain-containing protein [Mariniblastus sp.]
MPAAKIFVFVLLSSFLISSSAFAQGMGMGPMDDPPESERLESRIVMVPFVEDTGFRLGDTRVNVLGSFNPVINAGPTFAGDATAQAAFDRALAQWEAFISDPITVNFDVDFSPLSGNLLATATPVPVIAAYDVIRDQLVLDAGSEPDDTIALSLPTQAEASFDLPIGFGLSGGLEATKANLKAMGFMGLDAQFGPSDGVITFGTGVPFDFDNSDGVTPGTFDFESVAAHEIGHILGFSSAVDTVDFLIDSGATPAPGEPDVEITPTTFDLYRFEDGSANDPSTAGEFTTFARSLVPGSDDVFDQVLTGPGLTELPLSTGATNGDQFQASHFENGLGLGALEPSLGTGIIASVNNNDARVLDLIGYDISIGTAAVPEPGMALFTIFFASAAAVRRRRS